MKILSYVAPMVAYVFLYSKNKRFDYTLFLLLSLCEILFLPFIEEYIILFFVIITFLYSLLKKNSIIKSLYLASNPAFLVVLIILIGSQVVTILGGNLPIPIDYDLCMIVLVLLTSYVYTKIFKVRIYNQNLTCILTMAQLLFVIFFTVIIPYVLLFEVQALYSILIIIFFVFSIMAVLIIRQVTINDLQHEHEKKELLNYKEQQKILMAYQEDFIRVMHLIKDLLGDLENEYIKETIGNFIDEKSNEKLDYETMKAMDKIKIVSLNNLLLFFAYRSKMLDIDFRVDVNEVIFTVAMKELDLNKVLVSYINNAFKYTDNEHNPYVYISFLSDLTKLSIIVENNTKKPFDIQSISEKAKGLKIARDILSKYSFVNFETKKADNTFIQIITIHNE